MVPQFGIAKLVNIAPITMVYGRYIYSIHGVYKPTNITGGATTLNHLIWHFMGITQVAIWVKIGY